MLNGIKRVPSLGVLWSCLFRLLERARARKVEVIVVVKESSTQGPQYHADS